MGNTQTTLANLAIKKALEDRREIIQDLQRSGATLREIQVFLSRIAKLYLLTLEGIRFAVKDEKKNG